MTISAPTFQRLQTGVTSADDLRVRNPVNAALAWLSGDLVTQLNTHFGAVSTSISAALATFLLTSNTWRVAQTISLSTGSTVLTIATGDAGATGPSIISRHDTATPNTNDEMFRLVVQGRDSLANTTTYGQFRMILDDAADGSEDARWQIITTNAGAAGVRMAIGPGVVVGGPTGGDQGVGTINMAAPLYRNGTQVVSSRVTGYGDPFGAVSRATFSTTTVTTAALASFVAALYADLKAHGLVGN